MKNPYPNLRPSSSLVRTQAFQACDPGFKSRRPHQNRRIYGAKIVHQSIDRTQNSFRKSKDEIKEHSDAITQVYIQNFSNGFGEKKVEPLWLIYALWTKSIQTFRLNPHGILRILNRRRISCYISLRRDLKRDGVSTDKIGFTSSKLVCPL